VGDAAPSPLPTRPPTRPRRSARKPTVTYRRSPGSVSRPVPRVPPVPTGGAGRILGSLARFIPGRIFVDLLFGGVSRNAERVAATQQRDLDAYRLTAAERALARLARGSERLVRITPAKPVPNPLVEVRAAGNAGRAQLVRPAEIPLELQSFSDVVRLSESPVRLEFPEVSGSPRGGAPPSTLTPTLPNFWNPPAFFPLTPSISNPLVEVDLTQFRNPGVASNPLANPMTLAEPLPNPNPDRCRCRQRKRKAGKPGKGFFTIDSRGREKRRYWLNREGREHARNAG